MPRQVYTMEDPGDVRVTLKLLSLVKSFHEEMQAEVKVGSKTIETFEVRNGLRQ